MPPKNRACRKKAKNPEPMDATRAKRIRMSLIFARRKKMGLEPLKRWKKGRKWVPRKVTAALKRHDLKFHWPIRPADIPDDIESDFEDTKTSKLSNRPEASGLLKRSKSEDHLHGGYSQKSQKSQKPQKINSIIEKHLNRFRLLRRQQNYPKLADEIVKIQQAIIVKSHKIYTSDSIIPIIYQEGNEKILEDVANLIEDIVEKVVEITTTNNPADTEATPTQKRPYKRAGTSGKPRKPRNLAPKTVQNGPNSKMSRKRKAPELQMPKKSRTNASSPEVGEKFSYSDFSNAPDAKNPSAPKKSAPGPSTPVPTSSESSNSKNQNLKTKNHLLSNDPAPGSSIPPSEPAPTSPESSNPKVPELQRLPEIKNSATPGSLDIQNLPRSNARYLAPPERSTLQNPAPEAPNPKLPMARKAPIPILKSQNPYPADLTELKVNKTKRVRFTINRQRHRDRLNRRRRNFRHVRYSDYPSTSASGIHEASRIGRSPDEGSEGSMDSGTPEEDLEEAMESDASEEFPEGAMESDEDAWDMEAQAPDSPDSRALNSPLLELENPWRADLIRRENFEVSQFPNPRPSDPPAPPGISLYTLTNHLSEEWVKIAKDVLLEIPIENLIGRRFPEDLEIQVKGLFFYNKIERFFEMNWRAEPRPPKFRIAKNIARCFFFDPHTLIWKFVIDWKTLLKKLSAKEIYLMSCKEDLRGLPAEIFTNFSDSSDGSDFEVLDDGPDQPRIRDLEEILGKNEVQKPVRKNLGRSMSAMDFSELEKYAKKKMEEVKSGVLRHMGNLEKSKINPEHLNFEGLLGPNTSVGDPETKFVIISRTLQLPNAKEELECEESDFQRILDHLEQFSLLKISGDFEENIQKPKRNSVMSEYRKFQIFSKEVLESAKIRIELFRTQKLGKEFQKFKEAHLKIFHVHLALLEHLLQKIRRIFISYFSIFYAETSESLKWIREPMKKIRGSIGTILNAFFNTVPVMRQIEDLEDAMKKHDPEVIERHIAELACIAIERIRFPSSLDPRLQNFPWVNKLKDHEDTIDLLRFTFAETIPNINLELWEQENRSSFERASKLFGNFGCPRKTLYEEVFEQSNEFFKLLEPIVSKKDTDVKMKIYHIHRSFTGILEILRRQIPVQLTRMNQVDATMIYTALISNPKVEFDIYEAARDLNKIYKGLEPIRKWCLPVPPALIGFHAALFEKKIVVAMVREKRIRKVVSVHQYPLPNIRTLKFKGTACIGRIWIHEERFLRIALRTDKDFDGDWLMVEMPQRLLKHQKAFEIVEMDLIRKSFGKLKRELEDVEDN
ncbi:hypothetical protein B9Z55_007795 [Caenorhabditis nigoni]|uniref:Uncharacterized protein n=1 Tax=Caenorhabditis nigoni TaxID=1611254 RepID=A0A2G5VB87_9PELO|nr:hypothetical protein B9Z55_007795 [Caenorhabditis nigoni]